MTDPLDVARSALARQSELDNYARRLQTRLLEAGPTSSRGPGRSSTRSASPRSRSSSDLSSSVPRSHNEPGFLDYLVGQFAARPRCAVCLDHHGNVDTLIRIFLFGWDHALAHMPGPCSQWELLRDYDRVVYNNFAPKDHFALLYTHIFFLSHDNGVFQEANQAIMPPWFKPRPSQRRFTHAPLIDVIIWPDLRERLVLESSNGLSNDFSAALVFSVRFYFAGELNRAFKLNAETGRYRLSRSLKASLNDINHWRLDDHFLRMFPRYEDEVLPLSKLQEFIMLWRMPEALDEGDNSEEASPARQVQEIPADEDAERETASPEPQPVWSTTSSGRSPTDS